MANYKYKSVSFSAVMQISKNYEEVSSYYDNLISNHAVDGWELFLIDTMTTHKPAGCLSQAEQGTIKIAIFRKEN